MTAPAPLDAALILSLDFLELIAFAILPPTSAAVNAIPNPETTLLATLATFAPVDTVANPPPAPAALVVAAFQPS